jgi:hypothetical protein
MQDNQIILTDKGFKYLHELEPNKDYLVTKSGNLTKFIGYGSTSIVGYSVRLSTGESLLLSGDTIIDTKNNYDIKYMDVDMLLNMSNIEVNKTAPIDLKSRHKAGFSHNACYDIGFKRDFNKLRDIDFTLLSINQRKELIAGLIDNGETIIDINQIAIQDIQNDIINILIFIIRSLGFDAYKDHNDILMKMNSRIGILPIKSIEKRQDVICVMNTSNDNIILKVEYVEECPIKAGQILLIESDEPILIGYSLLPITQKR